VILPPIPPISRPAALAYSDPMFRTVVDVARHFAASGNIRGFLRALARQPLALFRVLLTVVRLPILDVSVTAGQAAVWFSEDFAPISTDIFTGRWAQAVLDLQPNDRTYLSGRRKQAVRTNVRNAQKLGVEAVTLADYGEWSSRTRQVLLSREDGLGMITQLRPPSPTQDLAYFAAVDAEGRPVVTTVVALFGECAVLVRSLSTPHHPAASPSRYLLHTFVRSELHKRGVRHLIGGTGVRSAPGLHYFQHLLGYELRNLRIHVLDGWDAGSSFVPDGVALSAAL
jgi:hypothetical protein